MVERRAFLAGAAALALSGCGRSETDDEPGGAPPERTSTSRDGDIELLQAALKMERENGGELHGAHADALARELDELGVEGDEGFTTGAQRDPQVVQGDAIAFYLDMLPKIYDGKLRSLVASILVVEAEQLAALRAEENQNPAPDAFVYGFKA